MIKVKNSMQVMRGWAARHAPWVGLVSILGAAQPAFAGDYEGSPQVAEFVGEMTRDYGFAGEQLMGVFREAERKQSILDAISRPAERVKQWKEYRPMFITDARIARGVDFWRQHEAVLARAEQEYGVPAQVIVSIIGVETFFGRNTGNYRVIDALSTLGFDYPPRAEFFRKELREFLLLAREEQVDPLTLKGSYAGAMGLPQFMPSNWERFGVDFDRDGRIDLLRSPSDAIGSVARYLTVLGAGRVMGTGWPFGTLLVNVAGCLAMGALYVLLAQRAALSPLLMTGILGGFTTFSAFSLDTLKLWETGQPAQAVAYVAGSVLLSLAAVALGAALARGAMT